MAGNSIFFRIKQVAVTVKGLILKKPDILFHFNGLCNSRYTIRAPLVLKPGVPYKTKIYISACQIKVNSIYFYLAHLVLIQLP